MISEKQQKIVRGRAGCRLVGKFHSNINNYQLYYQLYQLYHHYLYNLYKKYRGPTWGLEPGGRAGRAGGGGRDFLLFNLFRAVLLKTNIFPTLKASCSCETTHLQPGHNF
jgi:hypothetical protein